MTFQEALAEQIVLRGRNSPHSRHLLDLLKRPLARKRMEERTRQELGLTGKVDWSKVDWEKVWETVFSMLVAMLRLLIAL